jgi:hypothetical protein
MKLPLLCALAVLVVGACEGPLPSAPDAPPEVSGPLDLVAPRLDPKDLTQVVRVGREPNAIDEAPAGVDPRDIEFRDDDIPDENFASIVDPQTRAYFGSGRAGASGQHNYTGNVGRVHTTAHVAFQDRHLGSQSSERQENIPFLLDFGQLKFIWTRAEVSTDHECGLSVQGNSVHEANWEFFQGTGVSTWGKVSRATASGVVRQRDCSTRTETRSVGGSTSEGESYFYCTYLITYDLQTGQIYRAERLFCSTGGSEDDRF